MIKTYAQFLAVRKQRKLLAGGLRAALAERARDQLAEVHIAHMKADITSLDAEIAAFTKLRLPRAAHNAANKETSIFKFGSVNKAIRARRKVKKATAEQALKRLA